MIENSWRASYETAVLETEPNKLEARVKEAEHAISARFASLNGHISGGELLAMRDAISALQAMKRGREQKRNSSPITAKRTYRIVTMM